MHERRTTNRDRQKAATRQRLIDAATPLFLNNLYDAVGVRDIGEAAGTRGTAVYPHFGSKAGLFRVCLGVNPPTGADWLMAISMLATSSDPDASTLIERARR